MIPGLSSACSPTESSPPGPPVLSGYSRAVDGAAPLCYHSTSCAPDVNGRHGHFGGNAKMPKVKTNKTAAKRFKITGTGKLMFEHSRLNHLMMSKKDGGRARRMKQEGEPVAGERAKIRRLLPNSQ